MSYKIKVPPRPVESSEAVALHWLDRWMLWEGRHRRWFLPLAVGTVVLVCAGGGGWGWWWWQNQQAARLAGQAAEHYPALTQQTATPESQPPTLGDRCAKALPLYQRVSSKYRFSRLAPLALYYQANCQAELGRTDEAVALYQQVIADYPPTRDAVVFSAARLGYLYASQGNRPAAIEQFQWVTRQAAAPNRDQAYYELGRLYEADGNRDTAVSAYESVAKDFPKSPWATEASARIAQLVPAPQATAPPPAAP
jgi:tetratricopeptide (TPR) repeat protein